MTSAAAELVLRIEQRFRGPPTSGNGGYVAGLIARHLGGSDCEVTLRKPPPLARDLQLRREGDALNLCDGEELIASAVAATVDIEPASAPSAEEALGAMERCAGFQQHYFPGCFVCGPERDEGDGLRIFPGPVGGETVAAVWHPAPDLCDADGNVRSEFIWAALDCPGYFAVRSEAGAAVLGRIAVHIEAPVTAAAPLVVAGWRLGSSGRKHRVGTALYDRGEAVAWGEATWISLR